MSDKDAKPSINPDEKINDKKEGMNTKTEETDHTGLSEKTEVKNAHAAGDGSMGRNDQ